jgi:hypothetical protein
MNLDTTSWAELWGQLQGRLAAAAGGMLALGLVSLVVTVLLLPTFIARLPVDYFADDRVAAAAPRTLPHIALRALKNTFGAFLVVAGLLMLVLPGQGLLTILVGLVLVEFPGKRRLERAVARRPAVRAFLDAVRLRRGVASLRFD